MPDPAGPPVDSTLGALETPVVLVDLDRLEEDLADMAARAARAGVRLRPHAKTHKSTWIAGEQIRHGAGGLTVAKLGEAEVFADAGVDDLLVAYPIVGTEKHRRLRALAERVRVAVSLDDPSVAEALSILGRELPRPLGVLVEVDSGHHRLGRPPGEPAADLAMRVAAWPGLRLLGLMTHAGHAYRTRTPAERRAVAMEEAAALVRTAELLAARGIRDLELSVGSTPTAVHLEEVAAAFPAITEARPGTYAFYDANQVSLGVVAEERCALTVLATIVSRPAADRAVADAGSKTLAADPGVDGGWGRVLGEPRARIELLSEEHATIRLQPEMPWRVGDRIRIVPNHACNVPNLADVLLGVRGDRVERVIPVDARGRNR